MQALYSSRSKHNILRIIIVLFCILVAAACIYLLHYHLTTNTPWWKFKTQALITGQKAYSIPPRNPISIDRERVYVNDYHGHVYALNKHSGKPDWTFTTNNYSPYPPTATDDKLLYLADFDGRIYAIDKKDGREAWRFTIPELLQPDTPVYTTIHHVVFGARNGVLYALDKTNGTLVWQYRVGTPPVYVQNVGESIVHFGMIATAGNYIIVNTPYRSLLIVHESNGSIVQNIPLHSYVQEAPIVIQNEAFVKDGNERIIVIDVSTGKIKWEKILPYPMRGRLAFSPETLMYIDVQNNGYIIDKYNGREVARLSLDQTGAVCPLNSDVPLVSLAHKKRYIVGAANILCSYSTENGTYEWQTIVQGDVRDIQQINDDTLMIVSEKTNHSILSVLAINSGKIIDWADSIDILPSTLLIWENDQFFINRDERKLFSVPITSVSSYQRLELFKQCCRLGYPVPIPNFDKWEQTPITIKRPWQIRLYQLARIFLDNSLVVSMNEQKDISPPVYEFSFTHNDQFLNNPSAEVELTVTFVDDKTHTVKIHGFYADKNTWKARFSPPYPGRWRWTANMRIGIRSLSKMGIIANTSPRESTGYIQTTANSQQLTWANGIPFIGIGLQDTMHDYNVDGNPINQWSHIDNEPLETKTIKYTDMETYFRTYRDGEMGFFLYRFGVDNASFRLWKTIDPSGNRYAINEGVWADQVMLTLKKYNYRIMMSIFGFEPPITQIEIKEKRQALDHYLDYVVARYGAYVDIWELLNESMVSEAWINHVANYIRSIDPYHHPITTNWQRPELDSIDINSIHWYDNEPAQTIDTATQSVIHNALFWNKPVIISEQGNKDISWSYDSALRFRVKLWISYLNRTSIIFWNQTGGKYENPDNANIYLGRTELQYVSSLHKIAGDTIPDGTIRTLPSKNPFIRMYAQDNSKNILIYIYNAEGKKTSTSIYIDNNSSKKITWYNPSNGVPIEPRHRLVAIEDVIVSPMFLEDIVLILEK